MVDELLSILLGECAFVEIALDIDIEERRDAAHRHSGTVLCLHCTEVTEVEPLHSLASVCSRLRDVEAIDSSHVLQALERLDLHSYLLAQTDDLVDHLVLAHRSEVVLLLLNEAVDAIECHTTVVAYDAAAAVGVGKSSKNMIVTHEFHLRCVSVEHTVVMSLDVVVENVV